MNIRVTDRAYTFIDGETERETHTQNINKGCVQKNTHENVHNLIGITSLYIYICNTTR